MIGSGKVLSNEIGLKRIYDQKKCNKGFTLVELIVVLVIVAIIAAIAVPTFLAFIDMGRQNGYKNNARKCLAATQAALTEIYSNAGNSISPEKREEVKKLAYNSDIPEDTEFRVWTEKVLWDGQTEAIGDNIGSYTISLALYKEGGVYFAYNGKDWVKCEDEASALSKLSVGDKADNVIYMWPYSRDLAYIGDTPSSGTQGGDANISSSLKTVIFKLDDSLLDKIFFARDGRSDNSGKDSLKILFWEEEGSIKSYWYVEDGIDKFKINDNYIYYVTSDATVLVTEKKWKESDTSLTFSTVSEIKDYIYSEQNKQKDTFTFVADFTFESIVKKEFATLDKAKFKTLFTSYTNKVSCTEFKYKSADAIRVDDGDENGGMIYAWRSGNEVIWCTDADTAYMPADCSGFFMNNTAIESFDFSGFNVSKVTTMEGMFENAINLKNVKFSVAFNASVLTNVKDMFSGCTSLTSLDSENFYTGNLSSVEGMYRDCGSLTSIYFPSGFNTGNVTSFAEMFKGCSKVTSIELTSFNIEKAEDIDSMFEGCEAIGDIDTAAFDGIKPLSMNAVFKGCKNVTSIDINSWDLEKCRDISEAFYGCGSLTTLDLSKVRTGSSLNDMSYAFYGCGKLTVLDVSGFNTSKVNNMSHLFENCSSLKEIKGLDKLNTLSVTDFSYMFAYTDSIEVLDLTYFYTLNGNNFEGMFYGTSGENKLSTIYASLGFSVKDSCISQKVFAGNSNLKGGEGTLFSDDHTLADYAYVDGWKGKEGYFTDRIFKSQIDKNLFLNVFKNVDVDGIRQETGDDFDESSVPSNAVRVDDEKTDYKIFAWRDGETVVWWSDAQAVFFPDDCKNMFKGYTRLYSFDFTGFDTGKITDMTEMFSGCTNLKTVDMSTCDVSSVTNVFKMFYNAKALEKVDFGEEICFDSCRSFNCMFEGCKAIDQDFGEIRASENLQGMSWMFKECDSLKKVDLSALGADNIVEIGEAFYGCDNLTEVDLGGVKGTLGTISGAGTYQTGRGMHGIFSYCPKIKSIDLSGFKIDSGDYYQIGYAFRGCKELTTIYVSEDFVITSDDIDMFNDCNALTGGNGTQYAAVSDKKQKSKYAHIDSADNPGYLTLK